MSASDGITRNNSFSISALETGASWQFSSNSGGSWTSGSGTSFSLTDGNYAAGAIQVRQIDQAGNISAVTSNSAALSMETAAPTFTSPTTASFSENLPAGATVYTAVATDSNSITYSLTGTDASLFTINSSTGVVTINGRPNFAS